MSEVYLVFSSFLVLCIFAHLIIHDWIVLQPSEENRAVDLKEEPSKRASSFTPQDHEENLVGWDVYRARAARVARVCQRYGHLLRNQGKPLWRRLLVAYKEGLAYCMHGKV